jgi:hypothetical protein
MASRSLYRGRGTEDAHVIGMGRSDARRAKSGMMGRKGGWHDEEHPD